MDWKITDTISAPENDIDIIALDDTLERLQGGHSDAYAEVVEACSHEASTP